MKCKILFSKKLNNILLVVNKDLSFDKNLSGDFEYTNNLLQNSKIKILFILVAKF